MFETLHGVEGDQGHRRSAGDVRGPRLKYYGPVDGHDEQAVEKALRQAKEFAGPSSSTSSPRRAAATSPLDDDADHMHGIGKINPETGCPRGVRTDLDGRVQRGDGPHRGRTARRRGNHRGDAHPGGARRLRRRLPRPRLRRRHRRAARRDHGLGLASQDSTLSSRSTRPSSTGPSTRAHGLAHCTTGGCDVHPRPRRRHRQRRTLPQRDVGHDPDLDRARPAPRRTRDGEQVKHCCARRSTCPTRRPSCVSPRATCPTRWPPCDPWTASTSCTRPGARRSRSSSWASGRSPGCRSRWEKLAAQGHTARVVDPRWVLPVSPALVELARSAGAVAVVEDNLVNGGIGLPSRLPCARRESTCRYTRSASRSASSRTRRAPSSSRSSV